MNLFRKALMFATLWVFTSIAQAQPQGNVALIDVPPAWSANNAGVLNTMNAFYAANAFSAAALLHTYLVGSNNGTLPEDANYMLAGIPPGAAAYCGSVATAALYYSPYQAYLATTRDARVGHALLLFRGVSAFGGAAFCSWIARTQIYDFPRDNIETIQSKLDKCSNRKVRAGSGRTLLQEENMDEAITAYLQTTKLLAENLHKLKWYTRDYRIQKDFIAKCTPYLSRGEERYVPGPSEYNYCFGSPDIYKGNSSLYQALEWSNNAKNNSETEAKFYATLVIFDLVNTKEALKKVDDRLIVCGAQHEEL